MRTQYNQYALKPHYKKETREAILLGFFVHAPCAEYADARKRKRLVGSERTAAVDVLRVSVLQLAEQLLLRQRF